MAGTPKHNYPPNDELDALVRAIGQAAAADQLGIPRPTLQSHLQRQKLATQADPADPSLNSGEIREAIDDPTRVKVSRLEATITTLRRENREYEKALATQRELFERIVEETRVPVEVPKFAAKPRRGKDETPISVITPIFDQQFGQFVRPSDTPGNRGDYSVEEFDRRLERYVHAVKGIVRDRAEAYDVKEWIIPMGGDHVEGDEIFAGQAWQLELDPPRQVWVLASKMEAALRDIVRFAKEEVGVERIGLYGVDDNHGKVGGKRGGARPATYSWNWLFLMILFDKLRGEPIDQRAIEPGGSLFFRCAGHEFQLIHGHSIRGWGGLPYYGLTKFDGRSIRLHSRLYRYLLMGHHHQPAEIPNGAGETIVSGDWVGANNLSGMLTAASRPQQKVLFVSDEWGIAGTERVYFSDAHEYYEPTHIYEVEEGDGDGGEG